MDIDKQRISAVRTLAALGYNYSNGEWLPPGAVTGVVGAPLPFTAEADAMHGMLMLPADALVGCTESAEEDTELQAIVDLLEAYEVKRWPLGKEPGGTGDLLTLAARGQSSVGRICCATLTGGSR
jgi:hypothetical protein